MLNAPDRSIRAIGMLLSLLIALIAPTETTAQSKANPTSGPLYEELARMDSVLFETAFVTCDAEKFRSLFTEDAEFYHDKVAPAYGAEVSTLDGCPRENGVRRVLVPGSLEVYPIAEFGAIQLGEHRFLEGGSDTSTIAKFVHLWHRRNDAWVIARVLSFDHKSEAAQ